MDSFPEGTVIVCSFLNGQGFDGEPMSCSLVKLLDDQSVITSHQGVC